jgi:hypothetical protein
MIERWDFVVPKLHENERDMQYAHCYDCIAGVWVLVMADRHLSKDDTMYANVVDGSFRLKSVAVSLSMATCVQTRQLSFPRSQRLMLRPLRSVH